MDGNNIIIDTIFTQLEDLARKAPFWREWGTVGGCDWLPKAFKMMELQSC